METEITRLIASAVAAVVLGYVLYVAAYVKHKTEKQEDYYEVVIANKDYSASIPSDISLKKEKVESWYIGYRLAAVVAVLAAAAIGWAAAWIASQEYAALTQVEDCIVAGAGALLGGLVVDRYVIHPIADGKFWEKVEVPIIERFLHPDQTDVEASAKKLKKAVEETAPVIVNEPVPAPAADLPEGVFLKTIPFDEKVKLIEKLKKEIEDLKKSL